MAKYPDINHQHDVVVRTDRLILRPVATSDLSKVHRMRLKPTVMQFMPGVETEQDALKSYSVRRIELMMAEDRFSFAVVLQDTERPFESQVPDDDTVVGFIGITQPPEVFYIFDDQYWGHGFATEALESYLGTYWKTFPSGLSEVDEELRDILEAHIHEGNDGSERVATKCGFVHVRDDTENAHGRKVNKRILRLQQPQSL